MAEDWAAIAGEVTAALGEVGYLAQLEQPGTATGPAYDPTIGSATLTPVRVIEGYIERRDGNGMVTQVSRGLTMAATVTPQKGWRVLVRGAYHRIANVKPLAPGGVDLLFDVELEA